jgi:hypothetical protein
MIRVNIGTMITAFQMCGTNVSNQIDPYPDLPHNQDRDEDAEHVKRFGEEADAAEEKFLLFKHISSRSSY